VAGLQLAEQLQRQARSHLYYASNYFDFMYRAAEYLITAGHAYVDEQTAEEMRVNRGDFGKPGVDSPFRTRTPDENLARFREMRDGKLADGAAVLRAKISMQSPNINMRDPAIYRIRRATHHNTGDAWCIYPMYTFAHPIEDALEQITHSICTLEFEDQRPFYDWLLERLCEGGLLKAPPPRQYEFARLNLTYVITSKRKLAQLVNEKKVSGWDDPRMPTIVGLRRRGYTPEAIQLFAERIGVTKSDSWIDYSTLDGCLREDLENKAHRGMAVLDPVKLVLTNWAEVFGSDAYTEDCTQPALPHSAIAEGQTPPPDRVFKIGKDVWIEREDFEEVPPKGYKRLFPGNVVRLKGGYVIECTGVRQRRRRQSDRSARQSDRRHQERHPRRRQRQGQGRHHLGGRRRRRERRSAPVRPPVHRPATRRGRQELPGRAEPRQPEGGDGGRGAVTGRRQAGPEIPV
jgi:glutaminyl-tRNA synthetase